MSTEEHWIDPNKPYLDINLPERNVEVKTFFPEVNANGVRTGAVLVLGEKATNAIKELRQNDADMWIPNQPYLIGDRKKYEYLFVRK